MTNASFSIRLGKASDIDEIAAVYAESVASLCKDDYSPEVISFWQQSVPAEARLKSIANKSLWVAERNGQLIGYMVAIPGELIGLFISPQASGIGVGRVLAELGIHIAQGDEGGSVKLESTLNAAPFYEKLGFVKASRGFFSHGEEGAMQIPVINMLLAS